MELGTLLDKVTIGESDGFREKTVSELSKYAQGFLDKTVAYRKFFDLDSDYFPGVGIEYAVTDKYTECGYGRSASFHDSTNIALLEAIERYSSLFTPIKIKIFMLSSQTWTMLFTPRISFSHLLKNPLCSTMIIWRFIGQRRNL